MLSFVIADGLTSEITEPVRMLDGVPGICSPSLLSSEIIIVWMLFVPVIGYIVSEQDLIHSI